uniref:Ubiquitin-like domain-containing protein n=1 Tax=Oryza punctata TaxID=4537 RepID=A0A0E0KDT0_ORYPU
MHYYVDYDENHFNADAHCTCTVSVVPSSSNDKVAVEQEELQFASTPGNSGQGKFQVGFLLNRQTILVDAENDESVSAVIQRATEKAIYWPKDVYYTYSRGIIDKKKTVKESHLCKGSLIFVNCRNRGGADPPADCESCVFLSLEHTYRIAHRTSMIVDRMIKANKIPLLDHIRSVKGHDPWAEWFEPVKLPRSLLRSSKEWGGVLLRDAAAKVGQMLALCLERSHCSGKCFGGFDIHDVYYIEYYQLIEINAPVKDFTNGGYINDWLSFKKIIDDHFRYTDPTSGYQSYTLYMEDFMIRITLLEDLPSTGCSWRARAVFFKNISLESSERRVQIVEGLVGFYRERLKSDRELLEEVLHDCDYWKRRTRMVPRMNSALIFAVKNELQDWVPANAYFENCGYSQLYFCRCFFGHYTVPGQITKKELDTAIGILLPDHIPRAQKKLMVDYEKTQVKAKILSPSGNTARFSVHHIFGISSVGNDLAVPQKEKALPPSQRKRKRTSL